MLYADLVIDPMEGWELLNYEVRTHLSWKVCFLDAKGSFYLGESQ